MRGGETNGNMLDSNMSEWHGHQSSPSTLRLAGVTGVTGATLSTKHAKKERPHISSNISLDTS
jgi:hypothetical protein